MTAICGCRVIGHGEMKDIFGCRVYGFSRHIPNIYGRRLIGLFTMAITVIILDTGAGMLDFMAA
jgi:hypothetical protein